MNEKRGTHRGGDQRGGSPKETHDSDLLGRWRRARTRRALLELPEKLDLLIAAVLELTAELRAQGRTHR